MHKVPLSRLLPALLLVACSSGQPVAKPGEAAARPGAEGAPTAGAEPAAEEVRFEVGNVEVPNLPSAAPIAARSPHISLPQDFPAAALGKTREALEEAHKAATGEPLAIIADAGLDFPTLGKALEIARAVGFERCGLVVKTAPDAYGVLPLRIGGDGEVGAGELHVIVQADGYRLTLGPPLTDEPGTAPPRVTIPRKEGGKLYKVSVLDTEALEAKAGEFLGQTPARRVTVMADASITVDDLAVTLAALRGPKCGAAEEPGCRVSAVILAPAIVASTGAGADEEPRLGGGKGEGDGVIAHPAAVAATIEGQLDRDIIRRIVRAHMKEIRDCFDAALDKDPALSGRITVDFVISGAGKVKSATLGEGTLDDPALGKCMTKVVRSWTFPKSGDGGEVKVSYPFELSAG